MQLGRLHYLTRTLLVKETYDLSASVFCITSLVNFFLYILFVVVTFVFCSPYCVSSYSLLNRCSFVLGQGWVGWRNDTRNGQPIEIKFEFDKVREFTSVHIFCNNQFTRDVQVSTEKCTCH